MIDVFKNILCMRTSKKAFAILFALACLFQISTMGMVYAQSIQKQSDEIKLAQNKPNFNWNKGSFQKGRVQKAKLKKRKKVKKKRKARRKVRRKTKRKTKRKASQSHSRARKLAERNRLLTKKLNLMKKKDVCGYPWVYAYKYKRCICERRGFTQLGSQCVRLSRYCANGSSWSSVKRKCVCKAGFEYQNKQCVNVAALADDEDDDDEEPPILTSAASCAAPTNFAALSDKVGECPDGYSVKAGKCTLIGQDLAKVAALKKQKAEAALMAQKKAQQEEARKLVAAQKRKWAETQKNLKAKKAQEVARAKAQKAKAILAMQSAKRAQQSVEGAPKVVSALPYKGLDEPVYDLVKIRSCLYEAGFRGAREGKAKYSAFQETYDAFKKFRQRHQLSHKPMDIYDLESQKILFGLCRGGQARKVLPQRGASSQKALPQRSQSVSITQTSDGMTIGSNDAYSPVSITGATKPFRNTAQEALSCLPSDLYDFLTTTYRDKGGLKKCGTSCLPAPTTMNVADKKAYGEKYNITWCKTCLKVSSYMPLTEILKVERNAKVQVCTSPATTLQFSSEEPRFIGRSYPKARRLYRDFPESASDVTTIAVIIGNKDYKGAYSKNSNALNDAGAMFSLLSEHLGYAPDNIFDLRNATLAKMEAVLGSEHDGHGALWKRMQKHPKSRVMIYYSGHAMNNASNSQNYLLPIDAVKGREARTGYSISLLLNNLRKLRASSIMLVLEAEFGRKTGDAILPPNASEMSMQLQSSVPVPGLTIFMASHGNQKALEDPEFGIGLFTRHFISGLAGKADRKPIGNGDGKIDVVELYVHTANIVRLAARKSFGLLQNPTLGQTGNLVISRLKTSR